MKNLYILFLAVMAAFTVISCSSGDETTTEATATDNTEVVAVKGGQSAVVDDESAKDVVKVAASSPDHTTLVKAIQAAELVDALSNAGPFTVFAPTNTAFDQLPAGTLEDLLKPENQGKLKNILYYHVTPAKYNIEMLPDGMKIGMVDVGSTVFTSKDGKYQINGANILATIQASNGVIYVIDQVLLPPAS